MFTKHVRFIGLVGMLSLFMLMLLAPSGIEAADSTWTAQYFNNTSLSGGPVLTRQELEINHSWGTKNEDLPGVSKDNFSVRWTRKVNFPTTGTYRFSGTMDDGMRVWVDDVLVIDAWNTGSERTITGDRYLNAGDHNVKVEFFDAVLFATAKMSWQLVSTTTPPPTTIYNWRGEYYNNKDLVGSPALIRDDASINFNWNQGSPLPGTINTDNFSVRWTRNVNFAPGRYQFSASVDDGVRLWVNGILVIDNWKDQPLTTKTAELELYGGSIPVRMDYYDATGGAQAYLSWSQVGVTINNWRGEYFGNANLIGGATVVRDDAAIDFNWGEGAPMAGIDRDNFSVRWTRSVVFNPGRYRFTTRADDGVRLWVNNTLIIDRWYPQTIQTAEAEIELTGGPVVIKMEYFERTGFAEAHLSWTQVGTTPTGGPTTGVGTATVQSAQMNVRQGPAINYPIVATVNRGTVVQIGAYRNANGTWIMVILPDGRQGWSYAPLMQTSYPINNLPVWNDGGSGQAPNGATATVAGASYLNVRTGPGVSYTSIMAIPRGTIVTLLGRDSGGNWLKIQTPSGAQGWSSARFFQTSYSITSLPVLSN